jgi:hypothetical protein
MIEEKEQEGNKSSEAIYKDVISPFFRLIQRHPYFQERVAFLREKYKIDPSEIENKGKELKWMYADKERYNSLLSDSKKLAESFTYYRGLLREVWCAILDYIFINEMGLPNYRTSIKTYSATKKDNTLIMEPSCIYLEIAPHTSKRQIIDSWDIIVGKRKRERLLSVPKTSKREEMAWDLSQQGLTSVKIAKKVKEKFKNGIGVYTYNEVNLDKYRYKKALMKIRKFNTIL